MTKYWMTFTNVMKSILASITAHLRRAAYKFNVRSLQIELSDANRLIGEAETIHETMLRTRQELRNELADAMARLHALDEEIHRRETHYSIRLNR